MKRQQIASGSQVPLINASEIGRYVFCARAWWLQRVLGYAPHNLEALNQGTRRHDAHGRTVITARKQMAVVRWLLLAALVAAALLVLQLLRT